MSDVQPETKQQGAINVHVWDPVKGKVAGNYFMDLDPDVLSTITINGFHGSQAYVLSQYDSPIEIKFDGTLNFTEVQNQP